MALPVVTLASMLVISVKEAKKLKARPFIDDYTKDAGPEEV